MLRVTLAQVRVQARRFVAVGLAVMLGVAFLSATLMVNATTTASLRQSIGASYAKADLVVTGPAGEHVPSDLVDDLAAVPGVDTAHALQRAYSQLVTGAQTSMAALTATAPPSLETAIMTEGSYPARPGEVAIDEESAARLGVLPGDTVAVGSEDPASTTDQAAPASALTVTGLMEAGADPTLSGVVQVLAAPVVVAALTGPDAPVPTIQLSLGAGADAGTVAAEATRVLQESGGTPVPVVVTAEDQTVADVARLSDDTDVLTGVLLGFAVVAVIVAGLVISNTFSVLVAQRTRELALLRCIGAQRRQVRTSVLVEAIIVGFVSAVLGVLLATGVLAGLVVLSRQADVGSFAVLAVPPSAVLVGIGTGVLMTLLAALAPAHAATKVAPLAALRPSEQGDVAGRSGRVRLGTGLAALALGTVLLAVGAASVSLLSAMAGGALSFLGIVLLAPFFVPRSVAAIGRMARPLGVPGSLAAINAVRNPGRTAASAAALMVGVTLVTMMMVGAETARTSFGRELDENYAVDLEVTDADPSGVDAQTLQAVDGVRNVVELTPVILTGSEAGQEIVYAADPEEIAAVLRAQGVSLTDGMVLAPQSWTEPTVTLLGGGGSAELPVTATDSMFFKPLITSATAEQLGATPADALLDYFGGGAGPADEADATLGSSLGATYWLQLDDGLDGAAIADLRSRIVSATGLSEYQVTGAAIERVAYDEIIDVMLLIVTALLAVAVLIALIGVANTLSLSVLERRRENSLLRALGLTRGQLRGMLAVEAVLVAGVAALLGSVLGVLYGWVGAQAALGGIASVTPSVPLTQIGAVLAVAVLAGLLASVLPARRAARLSPVAGLAGD